MRNFSLHSPDHSQFQSIPPSISARRGLPALLQTTEDFQYREMERAFHSSGGIVSSDEVIGLLRARTGLPISVLAHRIVAHNVLSFEWQSRTMLPLFQFDLDTMTAREAVTDVIRELVPVLTGWDAALWFAQPNAWLGNSAPVDTIEVDPRAVFEAARAERFLARG
jgi:hypothetical protein